MIKVYLHGPLAKFGEMYELDIESPAEAVRAIAIQVPGFEAAVKAGSWHVLRGRLEEQDDVDEEGLAMSFGHQTEMHIIPEVEGAGSGGGWFSTIVGVVLIAAGYFTFGATSAMGMAMIAGGAGMAVGGIIQLTTKMPEAGINNETDQKASFLFDKPTNMSKQGVSIPRGYGRMLVGSIVISASLVSEEAETTGDDLISRVEWLAGRAIGAII